MRSSLQCGWTVPLLSIVPMKSLAITELHIPNSSGALNSADILGLAHIGIDAPPLTPVFVGDARTA